MAIRLLCRDGEVTIPRTCGEKMSLFRTSEFADVRSYTLRCKASTRAVNLLMGRVYGESEEVIITEDNFQELQNLSHELGFSGLDEELRAFQSTASEFTTVHKLAELEERVDDCDLQLAGVENEFTFIRTRLQQLDLLEQRLTNLELLLRKTDSELHNKLSNHDNLFDKTQRQIAQLINEVKKVEFIPKSDSREHEEPSSKPNTPLNVEREDLISLTRDVEMLKQSEHQHNKEILALAEKTGTGFWRETQFPCVESNFLEGIIAYLTNKCGGNVHDKGIVNVTASSARVKGAPKHAVDFQKPSEYFSENEKDTWICYDFQDLRVIPTSYSIRPFRVNRVGEHYLRSWVFEVSNDGTLWTEIDHCENNEALNCPFMTRNFKIGDVPENESFRFVRLRQTGKNFRGDYHVIITAMEIFGTLLTMERIGQPKPKEKEFVYEPRRWPPAFVPPELNGIIEHLSLECYGNVHDKGVVNITASSINSDRLHYHPKCAASLDTYSYYYSENKKNTWICYDFKEPRVIPKSYSLRCGHDSFGCYPKSWVLEVSNDGKSWTEVDRREDSNDLHGTHVCKNFAISSVPSASVRFIRLRQTAKNHSGDYRTVIIALEIFGILAFTQQQL